MLNHLFEDLVVMKEKLIVTQLPAFSHYYPFTNEDEALKAVSRNPQFWSLFLGD